MNIRDRIVLFDILSESVRQEIKREMIQGAYDDLQNLPPQYSRTDVEAKIRELAKEWGVEIKE